MATLLELGVSTGKWDSGLKKAQQALNAFTKSQGGLQQAFAKDSDKMSQFILMMGKMDSTANTAKGQLRDYRNSIEQLSNVFNNLSEAQKKGIEGQSVTVALDSLRQKAASARAEVERLNVAFGETSVKGSSGFGGFKDLLGGVAGKFGMSPAMFTGVGAAIAGIGTAAKLAGDNIRTAFSFERSMSGLSALTGKTGDDLNRLKEYAIELGSTTTLTASQVADAFRLIGSQQPQLLESSEALKEVTKNAITLAEAAGIDLQTASQTLSTSINQMGGDSSNAARFINVLAAASQKGAGDIAWLGEAITKSGTTAKAVGTSYEELVANLEQLAKAGYDASTAGTAMRSIIMNLEKKASKEFKPSIVGLTQAFKNLNDASLTLTQYQDMAGKMFAAQAKALAEAAGEADRMREAITGTNIAEEQAKTNTDNLDGSMKALASAWEGLNLHINSSNGILRDVVDWLKETVKWADETFTAAGRAKKALDDLQGGGEKNGRQIDKRTEYEVKQVQSATNSGTDYAKVRQQQILEQYDREIAQKEKELRDYQMQSAGTMGFTFGGVEDFENQIKALRTLRKEFREESNKIINPPKPTPTDTNIPNQQKSPTEDEEEKAKKTKKTAKELTAVQMVQQQITALTNESLTADDARLEVIKKEIASLNEQLKVYKAIQDEVRGIEPVLNKPVGDRGAFESEQRARFEAEMGDGKSAYTEKNMSAFISDMKKDLQTADLGSELYKNLTAQIADATAISNLMQTAIKNGMDVSQLDPQGLFKDVFKNAPGDYVSDDTLQGIVDKINTYLKEHGIEPIKIDFNTGNLAGVGKETQDAWKDAAKAVASVGSAMQQIEDPAAKVAGIVGQAIATIALGFAQATSKSAGGGIFAWIAAIAGGLGTMISTISAIKSATSGYEQGGIIKGNSYSGDNIGGVVDGSQYVGLNAGELVLTKAMQGNLASQLTDGGGMGAYGGSPYVTGDKIVLGINNWAKKSGRGELVFSK